MSASPEHWFYHLQQSALEQVLPEMLEKTHGKGWRTLVKIGPLTGDPAQKIADLDDYLWSYRKDSFLPHGRDDQPMADMQPVLLSASTKTAEGRDAVILISGGDVADLSGVERCITILDGGNEDDVISARTRWKAVKASGAKALYWRQDERGKWVQAG